MVEKINITKCRRNKLIIILNVILFIKMPTEVVIHNYIFYKIFSWTSPTFKFFFNFLVLTFHITSEFLPWQLLRKPSQRWHGFEYRSGLPPPSPHIQRHLWDCQHLQLLSKWLRHKLATPRRFHWSSPHQYLILRSDQN